MKTKLIFGSCYTWQQKFLTGKVFLKFVNELNDL